MMKKITTITLLFLFSTSVLAKKVENVEDYYHSWAIPHYKKPLPGNDVILKYIDPNYVKEIYKIEIDGGLILNTLYQDVGSQNADFSVVSLQLLEGKFKYLRGDNFELNTYASGYNFNYKTRQKKFSKVLFTIGCDFRYDRLLFGVMYDQSPISLISDFAYNVAYETMIIPYVGYQNKYDILKKYGLRFEVKGTLGIIAFSSVDHTKDFDVDDVKGLRVDLKTRIEKEVTDSIDLFWENNVVYKNTTRDATNEGIKNEYQPKQFDYTSRLGLSKSF